MRRGRRSARTDTLALLPLRIALPPQHIAHAEFANRKAPGAWDWLPCTDSVRGQGTGAMAREEKDRMRTHARFETLIALTLALVTGCAGAAPPRELWLYYGVNLADDAGVARLEQVWRRAAAAGYRHVMLADPKLARLGDMDAHYFANVARARALGGTLDLEIVPGVFQVGRSNSMLSHDPNLAEGLPARDARFVVDHGVARLEPDPPVSLDPRPDAVDLGVRIEDGVARVRDNLTRARFMYRVRVSPFRCYHVSVQIQTRNFTGNPLVQVVADGRAIHFIKSLGVERTQGWTTHHVVFNSLDHSDLTLYFGAWKPSRGLLEWRNWALEEVGPVNVLRRAGAPCVVAGQVEGRDYEPIRDPKLGVTPWKGEYQSWHEPPLIRTRLPDGTRLRVSWYQAAILYHGQVTCCISDPGVMDLLRDEAARAKAAWGARGYLMMHDEIRAMNWDASCQGRGQSPGALLAEHVRACSRLLSGATVYAWGDMFDPYQNAVKDYHLVNGDLAGSWEGLDSSVVIVNWNAARRGPSLRFFAGRGHRQIIAGYYDGRPGDVREWLASAARVPGVIGVMYTTWRDRYDDLEAFARAVRGGR